MRGGTRPRKGNGPSRPQLLPPRDLPVPTMRRVVQLLRVVDLDEAAAGVVAPAQRAPRRPAGRRAEPRIRRRFQDRRLVLSGAGKRVSPFPFLGNPPPPGPNPPPLPVPPRRGRRALIVSSHSLDEAIAPLVDAMPPRRRRAPSAEATARAHGSKARASTNVEHGLHRRVRGATAAAGSGSWCVRHQQPMLGRKWVRRQPYFKCMHL